MKTKKMIASCALALACLEASPTQMLAAATIVIHADPAVAPAKFAAEEIAAALLARGRQIEHASLEDAAVDGRGPRVVLVPLRHPISEQATRDQTRAAAARDLAPDGFALRRTSNEGRLTIWIAALNPGGLMYGGLEIAEQIRLRDFEAAATLAAGASMEINPHFAMRGVKFNVPLDVRTPSYSDMSDSAQANIAEVWSFDFWREFLDQLARDRYNFVSLWNLHPFPSLVKVPGYEEIALDDVQRSTIQFAEDYSTRTEDISSPAMLAQVETLRKMTIDEKIDFWRRVMAYGRDRNIDFYIVTWNTYTFGTGGKHGITDAIDNPVTIDYFRQSVAELFRTYPLLRGIGVTAGENMGAHNSSFDAKENWLFATYGQGVLDVAREQPGRKIRFIHRQHETRAADIARTFAPLTENPDIDFVFSFKYAQAHVMSSTTQPFHRGFTESLGDLKTLWTLRNDDALMFRWGAPDFVREFIANMPRNVSRGIHYGSDMWIWGREFLSLDPEAPRQLEIAKHWFQWMLWGRLSYDPTLGNDRVIALLGERFPAVDARGLFDAWQHASMTYPLTTGFHWGQYDFQWYIEGCHSRPGPAQTESGFHDVNRFITLAPHPGTDNISIPDYVAGSLAGKEMSGTPPERVADNLHAHASAALTLVATTDAGQNEELRQTLADIRAMAHLGHYYGHKISGATALEYFRKTGQSAHQQNAIAELTRAADAWAHYTTIAAAHYRNPLWTNRVGHVDWTELSAEVARDIAIAREGLATPAR